MLEDVATMDGPQDMWTNGDERNVGKRIFPSVIYPSFPFSDVFYREAHT